MKSNDNLSEKLDHFISLHPKLIDLSLGRMTALLNDLGNPQNATPPFIHIAGTNGKGSLLSFLDSCLTAQGYRVQTYSSPHLIHFSERIRLQGKPVANNILLDALQEVKKINGEKPITFFEATTAAAFLIFSRHKADILLLETGLGGRFDATHVSEKKPLATAITPISIDHEEFLGDTIEKIAFEKAAIQKPFCPSIIGEQKKNALAVIEKTAAEKQSPLLRKNHEWTWKMQNTPENKTWQFESNLISHRDLPPPGLKGAHQYDNAAQALATLAAISNQGFNITQSAIQKGLAQCFWPARLQLLSAPGTSPEIWLDGGHNAGAAQILAKEAKNWQDQPLDLMLGMLNNRDVADFIAPLLPFVRHIITTPIPHQPNSFPAPQLAQKITEINGLSKVTKKATKIEAVSSPEQGLALLTGKIENRRRVLITGSLYLAGHILSLQEKAEKQ